MSCWFFHRRIYSKKMTAYLKIVERTRDIYRIRTCKNCGEIQENNGVWVAVAGYDNWCYKNRGVTIGVKE